MFGYIERQYVVDCLGKSVMCHIIILFSLLFQIGKLPHVCGGTYNKCDECGLPDVGYSDECYRYDPGEKYRDEIYSLYVVW